MPTTVTEIRGSKTGGRAHYAWRLSSFANFGGIARICDMPGFVDIRAQLVGGAVTFESRPTSGGAWAAIPAANFLS